MRSSDDGRRRHWICCIRFLFFFFVCRDPASWWKKTHSSPTHPPKEMNEWINKYFLHDSSWPNFESPRRSWRPCSLQRQQELCCSLWFIRGMQTFCICLRIPEVFSRFFLVFYYSPREDKRNASFFFVISFPWFLFIETDPLCSLLIVNRSWLMTLLAQTASISHTLSALKNSSKDVAPRLLRRESFLHSCFSSPSGIPLGWLRIPTQRIPVCAVSDCSEQPLTSLLLPAASGSNSINRCLWVRL